MADNMPSVRYNELPNIGVLSDQIPADMLTMLNSEIQEIIKSDFKSQQPYNKTCNTCMFVWGVKFVFFLNVYP